MNLLKNIWDKTCNAAKTCWNYLFGKDGKLTTLLVQVINLCTQRAKDILEDKELIALALDAVKAAAEEQLTGNKAFVKARDKFVAAAKEAGKELKDSTVNFIIEFVYSGFKDAINVTNK